MKFTKTILVLFLFVSIFSATQGQTITFTISGDQNVHVPPNGELVKDFRFTIQGINDIASVSIYFKPQTQGSKDLVPTRYIDLRDDFETLVIEGSFTIRASDFPPGVGQGTIYASVSNPMREYYKSPGYSVSTIPSITNNMIRYTGNGGWPIYAVDPPLIKGSLPEGGAGTYTYQWQYHNNQVDWTDIPNATNQDYDPPTIYQPTHYRRIVSAGTTSISHSTLIYVQYVPQDLELGDYHAPNIDYTFYACRSITLTGGFFFLTPTPTIVLKAGKSIHLKTNTHLLPNTRLRIENVCVLPSARQSVAINETYVEPVLENQAVQSLIKPNPFTDSFDIQLQEKSLKSQIVVMALDGRVVYNTHTENKPVVSFDGRHLPVGLYLVRVIAADGKEEQFKLLKQ